MIRNPFRFIRVQSNRQSVIVLVHKMQLLGSNDLLLLAFAPKQNIAPQVLDLNRTVEVMLKMLKRLIGEDIGLSWQPGQDLWPVNVDPSQVDQILANLYVNARDAVAGAGRVTIETGRVSFDEDYCATHAGFVPGDFVLLAVSDNGCGMDNETIDKIFDPFFSTKEMDKGPLGLSDLVCAQGRQREARRTLEEGEQRYPIAFRVLEKAAAQ